MVDHFYSIINMMIISSKTNKHINKKQQKRKKKIESISNIFWGIFIPFPMELSKVLDKEIHAQTE